MYIEKRFLVVTILIMFVFINSANAIAGAAAQETAEMICSGGDTRPCGSNIGVCEYGIRTCVNGEWGICVGGTEPSLEKCDGLDNDCDSLIDENFDVDKDTYTMCGTRTTDGSYVIADCDNSNPNVNPGAKEICNLIDDNCDGVIDEGCECIDGDTRPCGSNIGVCEAGVRTCVNGKWGECLGGLGPDEEVCDGLDNNCDGVVDEGSLCPDGQSCINSVCVVPYGCIDGETRPCGSNVGMCESGTVTCINGVWDECIGGTRPTYEICDGLDNDCDSVVDEGCPVIKPELIKIKNDFRSYERPEFEIDARPVKIELYDVTGKAVDIQPEIQELEPNRFKIMIPEKRQFRAGLYKIKIEVIKNGVTYFEEQNFTWGVLAINTHKSIYLPNENAFIGIAVLGDGGHMVCDADVTLVITDPNNVQTTLSTANGDIKISPECEVYGVTNLPDYYTSYNVNGVGAYSMELTAMTYNGERSITDSFVVEQLPDFDVARSGPTRIYPPVPYTMSFIIKANRGYSGLIREYVPAGFEITPQDGLNIRIVGDAKELTWNKNLVNGETYNIYYEFDAPDISPEMFVLGPLEIGSWEEARQWMIASDAPNIAYYDPASDVQIQWSCAGIGCGTGHYEVLNDGTRQSSTPDTSDYISESAGNPGNVDEHQVNSVTESGINYITLWAYVQTGSKAQIYVRLQNNGIDVATNSVLPSTLAQWVYANWTSPSSIGTLTAEFEIARVGVGAPQSGYVYAWYLEVDYDDTPPSVTNASINSTSETEVYSIVKVNASVIDSGVGVDTVLIEMTRPDLTKQNLTTLQSGNEFFNDTILLDQLGNYSFKFFANDTLGNINFTENALTIDGFVNITVKDTTPPSIGNKFINESGPVFTNSIVCLNVSGISDNWQVDKVWATVTQSDGSVSNVIFSDTGSCAGGSGDGWYAAEVNVGPVAGVFYYNTTYVNDTSGNVNSNNTILSLSVVVPDTTPPQWSNPLESPTDPATYSPSQNYQFNITWNEPNSSIDTVLIEHNFTGVLQNYTVTSSVGNEYYYNWNNLAAGYYVWIEYANNTDGYMNVTDQFGYTVNRVISSCSLVFDPASATYGDLVNASCSCDNPESSAKLLRNGTDVTLSENNVYVELGAGSYDYVCNVTETQNYTSATTSTFYTVNKSDHIIHLALNGSESDQSFDYPISTNATGWLEIDQGVSGAVLYRNGSAVTSGSPAEELVLLGAGYYNYTYIYSESENYTSQSVSRFLTVNKASSEVNLLLNGTDSNFSINEDEYANLTAYLISGQGIIKLYQDGSLVNSGTSPLENITLYPYPGLFNITVIYDGNENYTGSFETHWLEVNDTTLPEFSAYSRYSDPPNEDQDVQVNVTVTDNVGVSTVLLEWNGSVNYTVTTNISDEYYFTILAGNYTAHDPVTYYWYASDPSGNMNRSEQQSFTVTNQLPWLSPVPSLNDTTPQTNDLLNCTAGNFQDNDNEDVEQARFWRWYKNDTEIVGEYSQTLDLGISGNGDKGDVIKCSERVYDGYDNSSWFNSSNTATVQNTPPTLPALDLPIDDYNTSDSTPFFNWTQSSDGDGDIITYEILIDDESGFNLPYIQSSIVSNNNYTAGFLNDWVYYWRVKAVTQDANSSYTSFRTFEIDTTPPQWSDLEYDSIIIFNNNQTVNITVTDQLSYVDTVMLEWNGTINYTMGKNGNVYTWTKNETEVSIISITIYMNDSLGNMNSTSFSYQIASGDIIPPNIVIDSPINQTYNTNWVYANVTLNEAGDWCGYSLDGTGNVTMNNDSSVHFYANVSGLGESQHNIRFSCNDTVGNMNVTEAVYFTIDTTPPEYSGLSESGDPIVYDDSLQINATWIDLTSSVDTVWFRSNYTGSWVNYSPSSSGNEYYYNFAPMQIPAGVLYYNWYANDSQGHWNTIMPVQTVTIDKASRIANLSFDKTSPITYGLTLIASCTATNPEDGVIKLYRNISGIDTDVTNTENGTEIVLPAGYWKYICNITETQNYTSATTTEFFMVNKADHTIHLALNGSESDQSFDYPMLTNATGWLEIGQGSATLYRNGSVVSNPEITQLAAGYYNYTYVYPESENYTGQTETWFLTINKGATIITLDASPGWSVIYGTGVNVSCSVNNNEVNLQLFRDGEDVIGENGVIVNLGAGNYDYVCNNTATQNYTSAQSSNTLNVSKASTITELYLNSVQNNLSVVYPSSTNASAFTDVLSVTLYRNGSAVVNPEVTQLAVGYYNYTAINFGNENYTGSSETLFLEVNRSASSCSLVFDPSSPATYGDLVNASCSCDNPEASAKLFRNGTDVTSSENNVFVGLAAGSYAYVCNVSATQNYTSAETFGVYVVNKSSTETSLYINGTKSNRSYNVNDIANFTVILNVSGKTVYLDTNITGWVLQSGTTPLENITTLAETGYFNITGYFLGDENYTNSSETHFITVSEGGDVQPPEWSNNQTDIVGVYSPTTLSYFNIIWIDNAAVDTVLIEGNWLGSAKNYSMVNIGSVYQYSTNLPAGTFYWKSYANDSAGNLNASDTWVFSVNKALEEVNLLLNGIDDNLTVNYTDSVNMTVYLNLNENVFLYVDGVLYESGLPPLENISTFPIGSYNITGTYSGNQNYSGSFETHWLGVIDGMPPVIVNISSHLITYNSAVVSFYTDEPAISALFYNISLPPKMDVNLVLFHNFSLTDLANGTTYYYDIYSCDENFNCGWSNLYSFTTLACVEYWSCTAWSDSTCGTRNCTDQNSCGTEFEKEIETLGCPPPEEPPSDGVGDGEEELRNATWILRLLPGIWLERSSRLQEGTESVLGVSNLTTRIIENLLRTSRNITPRIYAVRSINVTADTSTLYMGMVYDGDKPVNNFIVYDTLPKSFAESSDDIEVTVDTAVVAWEVVEPDPQYVFLYSELLPQQEVTIIYKINRKVDLSDIVNKTFTEVYAESFEGVIVCNNNGICEPELGENENTCPGDCPITLLCEPYEFQCVGDILQQCNEFGIDWIDVDECEWGCSDDKCNPRPPEVSSGIILLIVIIIIGFVLAYTIISSRSRKRKAKPEKKKPGILDKIAKIKVLGSIVNVLKRVKILPKRKKQVRLTRVEREKLIAEALEKKIAKRVGKAKEVKKRAVKKGEPRRVKKVKKRIKKPRRKPKIKQKRSRRMKKR